MSPAAGPDPGQPLSHAVELVQQGEVELRADPPAALATFASALQLIDRIEAELPPSQRESVLMLRGRALNRRGRALRLTGDAAAARAAYQESLQLFQQVAPDTREVSSNLNGLGLLSHESGDLRRARALFEQAIPIDLTLDPDHVNLVTTTNNLALVLLDLGRVPEAIDALLAASRVAEKIEPPSPLLGITLDRLGSAYARVPDYERAADAAWKALRLWLGQGADQELWMAIGAFIAYMGKQGKQDAALAALEHFARDLIQDGFETGGLQLLRNLVEARVKLAPKEAKTALALERAANVLTSRAKYVPALELRDHAVAIFEALDPGSLDTAIALTNRAQLQIALGALGAARSGLARAGVIYQDGASINRAYWLAALSRLALEEDDREAAEMWARQALQLSESLAPESTDEAYFASELGVVLLKNDPEEASGHFERALSIYQRKDPDAAPVTTTKAHLSLVREMQARSGEATQLLEEAGRMAGGDNSDASTSAFVSLLLAREHETANRLPQAAEWATRALELARGHAPGSMAELLSLNMLARLELRGGQTDAAIDHYQASIQIAEALRDRAGAPGSQGSVSARLRSSYGGLIAALYRSDPAQQATRAFEVAERSRAADLIVLVGTRGARLSASSAHQHDLLQRRDVLWRGIARSYALLVQGVRHPAEVIAALAQGGEFDTGARKLAVDVAERPRLQQELQAVEAEIHESFPTLAQFRRPEPVTVEGLQHDLPAGTMILEYAFANELNELYVWAIRHDRIHWAQVPMSLGDSSAILALFGIGRTVRADDARSSFQPNPSGKAAADLGAEAGGRLLLGTLPPDLFEGITDLRVFPDGPLHYVPFEVLKLPGSSQEIVLDRYAVTYGTSATALAAIATSWRPADSYEGPFIGFGGVVPSDGEPRPRDEDRFFAYRLYDLGPLAASGGEVIDIATGFGPGALARVGAEATERQVKVKAPGFRVVHFATHGIVEDGEPMLGGLLLSRPTAEEQQADETLDDFLQIFEMFDLRLTAELVVCSACRTGLGKLESGEGVRGIAHALFAAGARSLILSLWSVPDQATAELMRRCYTYARDGLPISHALRAAKLDIRKESKWEDPYYWAGFVALGPADQPLSSASSP
jgi:tetratricopeptide (TPR) repeat protein